MYFIREIFVKALPVHSVKTYRREYRYSSTHSDPGLFKSGGKTRSDSYLNALWQFSLQRRNKSIGVV